MYKRFFYSLIVGLLICGCDDDTSSGNEQQTTTTTTTTTTPTQPVSADTETDEACNDSTQEFCEGQIAHFCGDNNKIVLRDCSKLSPGLSCQKMTEDNYVDCVAPCDSTHFEDYISCEGKDIANHFCMDVNGGGQYEFIVLSQTCAHYCVNGQCSDKPLAEENAACNENNFEPQCNGQDSYNCVNGHITKTTCSAGLSCAIQFGSKKSECKF